MCVFVKSKHINVHCISMEHLPIDSEPIMFLCKSHTHVSIQLTTLSTYMELLFDRFSKLILVN